MAKEQTPQTTTRTPTKQMRRRALIATLLVVVVLFGANIVNLGRLQIFESEDWQKRAVSQQLSDTVVSAKRAFLCKK